MHTYKPKIERRSKKACHCPLHALCRHQLCYSYRAKLISVCETNSHPQKSSLSVKKHYCSLYKSEQHTVIDFVFACSVIPVTQSGITASFESYSRGRGDGMWSESQVKGQLLGAERAKLKPKQKCSRCSIIF